MALCVPAFGISDPNDYAVLVYKVTVNISAADFNDFGQPHAEFVAGKVDGYVLARFDRGDLGTSVRDNNDRAMFVLLDKKAKKYIVVSDANTNDEVGFNFDAEDYQIFNKIDKNGKDSNKDYIFAYLHLNVSNSQSIFELTAQGGMTPLTSSVIEGSTKIPVPKNITFNNVAVYLDTNSSIGYNNTVSATLDPKYTKLATSGDLSVKGAADLIVADLAAKGWVVGSAADYFNWGHHVTE